ncbi:hypothetical protein CFC21_033364 [Triticum aestivum]|uniref:Uncharacterized protein n=2 Tax=Triticum aestivum TaxID=4565 RepID=A0A3B6E8W0_WHEAT|nr:uncharacterized protein LOC123057496 [Triticum aestivum]KAF7020244.1 hypothetical protein CFC21_033364 [Triticum aestivum]
MGRSRASQRRQIMSKGGHARPPQPRSRLISKLEESDGALLCLIAATCTLSTSSVGNFQVFSLSDDGLTNKKYYELVTGTMEVAICYPYIFLKLHEFLPNLLPTPATPAPLKSWFACRPNVRIFGDTAVLVIISYLLLLGINLSFAWLAIFPVMAIVFIRALYMKLNRCRVTQGSSNVDEKSVKTPVELQIMVVATFGALLVMDQLDDDAAVGFSISQFLLFLSSMVAALTRMMMKLPADPFPGSAPASELLHKTLLILLLVTVHTVAVEWLGKDVVLFCMPEVVPVLLWCSLHLDRPRHSPLISVDKMKPYMKGIIALCALVAAPLFAYLVNSMDVSGLSGCTRIMVSCGVLGVLTYYLVFMLRHWPCPGQKQGGSSKDDVPSSGMLKFWAEALLMAATFLLLLRYLVSVRLGLQQSLVGTLCRNVQRL